MGSRLDISQSPSEKRILRGGSEVLTVENEIQYRVRRLTPLECERLQAFPDKWTDIGEWTDTKGKVHKEADSNRYKALGNSICTAAWTDILQSIAEKCPEKTMASLFDGIGGFPLIWQRDCGGKAVWASEIEEFCIAVTKKHFAEDSEDWKQRHCQGPIYKPNEE